MSLFKKNINHDIKLTPRQDSRVEIELHKSASKEAKKKADQVNAHLRALLGQDEFTVTIFLAAGGHLPRKHKHGNG